MSPRVAIHKSAGPLRVDCKKAGAGSVDEAIDSKRNGSLWGNLVLTLGVGYFVDRDTGAGFDYPAAVTVVMKKAGVSAPLDAAPAGSIVY